MTNELVKKLAQASKSLGAFQADKRNQQQKYDYISADQVLSRVGAALAENGLMIVPAIVDGEMDAVPWKQGFRFDAVVLIEMTITDGENEMIQKWVGRGSDYGVPDKALYKAITSGHKYFLMKLFNIGVGNEDGEHEVQPAQKQATNGSKPAQQAEPMITEKQRKQLHATGVKVYGDEWDDKRAAMSAAFKAKSSNEWTQEQASRVIEGMNAKLAERAEDVPLFEDEATAEMYSE